MGRPTSPGEGPLEFIETNNVTRYRGQDKSSAELRLGGFCSKTTLNTPTRFQPDGRYGRIADPEQASPSVGLCMARWVDAKRSFAG